MKAPAPPLPAGPGSYVLLINLEGPATIEVGRLGTIDFDAGCYAYVGSALRGIAARINRHLRRQKKLHWHVDYLLQHGQLSEVIWTLSDERLECRIAEYLRNLDLRSVPHFGASDCRCPSHLFFASGWESLQANLRDAFASIGTVGRLTVIARNATIET